MSAYIGNIEAKVDAKGRVFIPASYRKLLADTEKERVVMRKDPTHCCLTIYPESIWNQKLDNFKSKLDEWNPTDQLLLMQFVSDAEFLDIDNQGRVLLQKKYLEMIQADSDVLFVGAIDRFCVWSKAVYESTKLSTEEFARLMNEKMTRKQEL
jgi:MraZ protein